MVTNPKQKGWMYHFIPEEYLIVSILLFHFHLVLICVTYILTIQVALISNGQDCSCILSESCISMGSPLYV